MQKIILAGKEFEVESPLRFSKLKFVEPAMLRARQMLLSAKEANVPVAEACYDEVAIALSYAIGMKRAEFDEMQISQKELAAAYQEVGLALGMFVKEQEGEGQAKSPNQ